MVGELHASEEPTESEWGNPSSGKGRDHRDMRRWGAPGELKHLSTPRKQNQQGRRETAHQGWWSSDARLWGEARSSGERTGLAPKPASPSREGGGGVGGHFQGASFGRSPTRTRSGYAKGLGRPTGAGESPVADGCGAVCGE